MKTPVEIVHDAKAFLSSTAATVGGVAVTIAGLAAAAAVLIPDQYESVKTRVVAIGALAATIGGIARQLIAWLDPNNPSFGRVKVNPDDFLDPNDPKAIEAHLAEIEANGVNEGLLPDESSTGTEQETEPEPEGI